MTSLLVVPAAVARLLTGRLRSLLALAVATRAGPGGGRPLPRPLARRAAGPRGGRGRRRAVRGHGGGPVTAPAVQAEALAAGYGSGPPALEEVTFSLDPGTSLCVLGPNGGGKTTLFRVLGRRPRPDDRQRRGRRAARPAPPGRPPAARLPRQRAGRGADGHPGPGTLVASAAAGPSARPRPPRWRAWGWRRARPSASARCRAGSASGCCWPARWCRTPPCSCSTSRSARVDPVSAERIEGLFAELRAEGRTVLVSTHDVESARALRPGAVPQPPPGGVRRPRGDAQPQRARGHLRRGDRGPRRGRRGPSPSSTTRTRCRPPPLSSTPSAPASAAVRWRRSRCSARSAAGSRSGSPRSGCPTPPSRWPTACCPGWWWPR